MYKNSLATLKHKHIHESATMLSKKLLIAGKINILGVVASILLLIVILTSKPWWTLKGGEDFLQVTYSPLNISIVVLGRTVEIPLISYLTQSALIILVLSAIMLLVGSVIADKRIGLSLVKVGSDKPLVIVIVFTVTLAVLQKLVEQMMGIEIPLIGEKTVTLETVIDNTKIQASMLMRADIGIHYYIMWIIAVIALLSGIIHRVAYKTEAWSRENIGQSH